MDEFDLEYLTEAEIEMLKGARYREFCSDSDAGILMPITEMPDDIKYFVKALIEERKKNN